MTQPPPRPIDAHSTLAFAPGCRLHPTRDLVLIPEGTLELRGPARAVLALVDGHRTVDQIVGTLLEEFDTPDPLLLRGDVTGLLRGMAERGVLREVAHPGS